MKNADGVPKTLRAFLELGIQNDKKREMMNQKGSVKQLHMQ